MSKIKSQRQIKLRLDAPVTYAALENLTNINQETINAALEGNEQASADIADFRQKQELKAANAAAVYGNLTEGVKALQTTVKEESKFVKNAGQAVQSMTNEWAEVRLSDKKTGHEIERTAIRSDYQLVEEDYSHQKRLNLLPDEHRANIRLIEIRNTQEKENLNKSVFTEFHQLSKLNQAKHHLSTINKYGSQAFGFIGNLFK